MKLREIKNGILASLGVFTKRIFVGPRTAEIFISNFCLEKCPWCGLYSPFLKNPQNNIKTKKNFMDFNLVKALINELSKIGTFRIELFGDGEPVLHPNILDIVSYIRANTAIECTLITSGVPLDKNLAKNIAELGVHFGIGLHAASFLTWNRIFGKNSEKDFNKIIDVIKLINTTGHSKTTINFVISSINYLEIVDIVNLAINTKCYAINFIPVTTFEGMDFLKLNEEQIKVLRSKICEAKIIAKKKKLKTNLYATSLVSFSKDNNSFSTKDVYQKKPCYIGWFRTHVSIEGEVYPCCGLMDKLSMGNINEKSFKEIWISDQYKEFRKKGLSLPKKDISYIDNRCSNCPDHYYNSLIHELLSFRLWRWKR